MLYKSLLLAALASFAAAQNGFTMTSLSTISAGSPYNITWSPSTPGSVTLILRQGSSTALSTVATIASSIPNSGSYSWTPSSTLPAGSDYAFEIVSDANSDLINYSGQFALASSGTASSAAPSSPSSTASSSASSQSSILSSSSAFSASGSTTSGSMTSSASSGSSKTETNTVSGSSSMETGMSSASGKETSVESGSKTTAGAKMSGTSTGTGSSSSTSATGNAAVGLKAGGALLGLVGVVMGAL